MAPLLAQRACLVLVCALVLLATHARAADPCVFEAGVLAPADAALACMYTVPASKAVIANALQSVAATYPLFTFLDMARAPALNNPGLAGLDVGPVAVMEEVAALAAKDYKFDFDFHTDVVNIFRRLRDAHTLYRYPMCYRGGVFSQPLPLLSFVENGVQEIRVGTVFDEPVVAWFQQHLGVDVTQLQNATVATINGQPALGYLIDFANNSVGFSKDLGTRLNLALTTYEPRPDLPPEQRTHIPSAFQYRSGLLSPFPQVGETVQYQLVLPNGAPASLTAPWLVLPMYSVSNQSQFAAACAQPSESLAAARPEARAAPTRDMLRELRELPRMPRVRAAAAAAAAAAIGNTSCPVPGACFSLLASAPGVSVYQLQGEGVAGRTAVLFMDTFEPNDTAAFEAAAVSGLQQAAANGAANLLIDLTYNGGGDICLGLSMLRVLFPGDPRPWSPTDMPAAPLAVRMTEAAAANNVSDNVWSFQSYQRDDGTNFTGPDWLTGGAAHWRGGIVSNYSQLLHLSPYACSYDPTPPPPVGGAFGSMVILTKGVCGSTCALFSQHARQYDNVRTVVAGGISGRPQQYFSFPGLQVLDTPDLWEEIEEVLPGASVPLVTSATYRMCIREIYPSRGSTAFPTEYTFQPADARVDYAADTAEMPELLWYQVAQQLFA